MRTPSYCHIAAGRERGQCIEGFAGVGGSRCLSVLAGVCLVTLICFGCDTEENPLAPYEGERALIIQGVTSNFRPAVQWVGGRVAAIGINRGDKAALDSTLVWLKTANGNELSAPVSIEGEFDREIVEQYGGSPVDSLEDGQTYTLWLAEKDAYDGGLDTTAFDEFSLRDTTFDSSYIFAGRSGGGVEVEFTIIEKETLVSNEYEIRWAPASIGFRRLAIRDASSGGFTNLLWHVVIPDTSSAHIFPPVTIGETPPDAILATEWDGWSGGTQTLWAATDEWDGESFGFRSEGYASFTVFATNFE